MGAGRGKEVIAQIKNWNKIKHDRVDTRFVHLQDAQLVR